MASTRSFSSYSSETVEDDDEEEESVASPIKTMQQLLDDIDKVKANSKLTLKSFEKIDAGSTKMAANRNNSIEGRRQIKTIIEHIQTLEREMKAMTKESDPNWPAKTFDRTKIDALNTLSNLIDELNRFDQNLVKTTEAVEKTAPVNIQYSKRSSSDETSNGVEDYDSKLPVRDTNKTITPATTIQKRTSSTDKTASDDDDDDEEEEDGDDDAVNDNHQLLNELKSRKVLHDDQKRTADTGSSSQTSKSSHANRQPSNINPHEVSQSSPIFQKNAIKLTSTPLSHKKIPADDDDEDDDDDDEDNDNSSEYTVSDEAEDGVELDELKQARKSIKNVAESESDSPYDNTHAEDDDDSDSADQHVQELREAKYLPGDQFRVLRNFESVYSDDLTINQGEILILIEQQTKNWWLFKNAETQQQGLVSVNHIEALSRAINKELRHRITSPVSPSTLVDIVQSKGYIPSGFIASDLAPLVDDEQYKLFYTLMPTMTDSNLALADITWDYDTDQIHTEKVKYQKILTLQKCSRIPKMKNDKIKVLNYCVRVCLYDGFHIISNIHSIRAFKSKKTKRHHSTQSWIFTKNDDKTFVDEQPKLLIRSNEMDPKTPTYLLMQLSQYCELRTNNERCEIGCGSAMIPIDDNQPSRIRRIKSYNEFLKGGHFYELNVDLDSKYKQYHSMGFKGKLDQQKKARIQFSLEPTDKNSDLLYDYLPVTSMIVPLNLVKIVAIYRHELAYHLEKRSHENVLSSAPLHSKFLSTFYQTLEQPDLINIFNTLCHEHKKLNIAQERQQCILIYESYIYALLFYRKLKPYNFHDGKERRQRKQIIREIMDRLLPSKKNTQPDIAAILLDQSLTEHWKPFTTNEICFSLQKFAYNFVS
ncbi:unnamed protein product [Rotaria socialis]|uniref:SH3 domain-containing protein n=1 Tax=Rotaria socialis TaxID=392032 RepID=A0A820VE75_9BILA|nr:unnamed protein product [Rotaria socialis]CAF3408497.1 unnamed protein product [Rotaria socialis]CAF3476954.1 unnamed protein product [Rotaria socialis]CAF4275295.1 unnamed protein product [Rotaria socialis]CAF4389234.1 unnamed protein product [Rotaria socialis]